VPTATPAVVPAIAGITVSNGTIDTTGTIEIFFNISGVSGLSDDDFDVTATLNGEPYALGSLIFDDALNTFSFTQIPQLFEDQILEVTVSALTSNVSGTATGSATIAGDPAANPRIIKGLVLRNGYLGIVFNGNVTGLSASDFEVDMQLNGSSYIPDNLLFDPADNSFSFDSIPQTTQDQVLSVTVKSGTGTNGIVGEVTVSLTLMSFYNYIELLGFEPHDSEGAVTGAEVEFILSPDIGNPLETSVSLYVGKDLLARNSSANVEKGSSVACPFEAGAPAETSSIGGFSAAAAAQPTWTVVEDWVTAAIPTRIIIEVVTSDGVYKFDSQDTVWVNQVWEGNVAYNRVDTNLLFGLNAFTDIQEGVDAVNDNGRVYVAQGEYTVYANDYTGYYGIVIYKPMSLLGAQANIPAYENEKRSGAESIIRGGEMDDDANGGGAITVSKSAGAVEINGFTFKYNDVGIDVSVYAGEEEPAGPYAEGLDIKYNRFIDNAIDLMLDNSDSNIQNYNISNNIFGLKEVAKVPYIDMEVRRDVVDAMHKLEEAASSDGNFLTLDLSLGLFLLNPQGLSFEGNTIYNKAIGLGILGGASGGNAVYSNYIHGNTIGVGLLGVASSDSHTADINCNVFKFNTLGIASLLSGKTNALGNYWGDVNWTNIKTAILGERDINDNSSTVEYFPWALDESCTRFANDDLTKIIVNEKWSEKIIGNQVWFGDKDYYIGVNAYPDIQTAVNNSSSDYLQGMLRDSEGNYIVPEIYVAPGYYDEIDKRNPEDDGLSILLPVKIIGLLPEAEENSDQAFAEDADAQPDAVYVKGNVIINSYFALPECFTIANLTIQGDANRGIPGDLIINGAYAVCLYGNRLDGSIIFNYIPPYIYNESLQELYTEDEISMENNNAPVMFKEAEIYSFSVVYDGDKVAEGEIDPEAATVVFKMPVAEDITALTPDITISSRADITPSGPQNFESAVQYTVTAGDGTPRIWTVTCVHEPVITSFVVDEQDEGTESVIDMLYRLVTFTVPYGTDMGAMMPVITVSDNGAADPASGVAPGFTVHPENSKVYTAAYKVIPEGGDGTVFYEWTVICLEGPNDENDILDFAIANQAELGPIVDGSPIGLEMEGYKIDYSMSGAGLLTFWLPGASAADIAALVPAIAVSPEACVVFAAAPDFSDEFVDFTVVAGNGDTKDWFIRCIPASSKTDITGFKATGYIDGSSSVTDVVYSLIINNDEQSVVFEVVYGTDITRITPVITVSKGAIADPSPTEQQNFTNAVTYVVTAYYGKTAAIWTVTCVVLPEGIEPD